MLTPRYRPAHLVISKPPGRQLYQILVVGKGKEDLLSKAVGVLAARGIHPLQMRSHYDESSGEFVADLYCDLRGSKSSQEQLADDIRKQGFSEVEICNLEDSLFDKFHFPVMMWNKYRVVIVRAQPFVKIEKRLIEKMGSAGGALMFEEGKNYALDTIMQYREVLGSSPTKILLENIRDGLRATGWGLLELRGGGDTFEASMEDPPFADERTVRENRFLLGIVAGVLEALHGREFRVADSSYDSEKRTLFMTFRPVG